MQLGFIIGGGYPWLANVTIGADVREGVPLLAAVTTDDGAIECTATAAADAIGVCQETVTHVTAQQTDASDAERVAKVIVNPDAVWKAKMSGAAAEDTAMVLFTVDTVDSAGTSVETDGDATHALDGTIWGLSGANKGRKRKVDATSGNHFSVLVPFEPIAVGDTFLAFPTFPFCNTNNIQLTTNLTQVRDDIAVGTGIEAIMVGGEFNGRNDSFAYLMFNDHLLSHALAGVDN